MIVVQCNASAVYVGQGKRNELFVCEINSAAFELGFAVWQMPRFTDVGGDVSNRSLRCNLIDTTIRLWQ